MHQGTLVDLDAGLAMEAAALGLEEGLAFADSVIYTVAKKHDAILWTQDAHFEGKLASGMAQPNAIVFKFIFVEVVLIISANEEGAGR